MLVDYWIPSAPACAIDAWCYIKCTFHFSEKSVQNIGANIDGLFTWWRKQQNVHCTCTLFVMIWLLIRNASNSITIEWVPVHRTLMQWKNAQFVDVFIVSFESCTLSNECFCIAITIEYCLSADAWVNDVDVSMESHLKAMFTQYTLFFSNWMAYKTTTSVWDSSNGFLLKIISSYVFSANSKMMFKIRVFRLNEFSFIFPLWFQPKKIKKPFYCC